MSDIDFEVPEDQQIGTYSNVAQVTTHGNDFTIDFAVAINHKDRIRAKVIQRVRIPASLVFDLARALGDTLDKHEKQFGQLPPRNVP